MKFLTKINQRFLLLLTIVLLVVSVSAFFGLKVILLENTKKNLIEQELLIENHLKTRSVPPNVFPIIEVKKTTELKLEKPKFSSTLIEEKFENEWEEYLEYTSTIKVNDTFYEIKLRQSTFENEDLGTILTTTFGVLMLLVLAVTYFVSKKINKTVWKDFEYNLKQIEHFNFLGNQSLDLVSTNIEEFDRLNKVVDNLTNKLKSDYRSLKEFSENASHEIQTPISVVLLNLEEILQQDLNEESFEKVHASINALKRLSALNQSHILLTKIENQQFIAKNAISLNEIIVRKMQEYVVLSDNKSLKVSYDFKVPFVCKINEQLAEILISNLISNAIRHNMEKGEIIFTTKENELRICNTGMENTFTNATIFNRFTKGNSSSFGLGLAIVKNICDVNQLTVHYSMDEFHCFSIKKS